MLSLILNIKKWVYRNLVYLHFKKLGFVKDKAKAIAKDACELKYGKK